MTTLLVGKQIHYVLGKDLGFNKDAVLYVRTPFNKRNTDLKQVFFDKLKSITQIKILSMGSDAPASSNTHSTSFTYTDNKVQHTTDVLIKHGDTSYLHVYGLKLLAGRNLIPHDTSGAFIVNQMYCRFLGFKNPQQIIGKLIDIGDRKVPIVGVVGDFNQKSLHHAIKPAAICYSTDNRYMRTVHIRLKPQDSNSNNWKQAINRTKQAWTQVFPDEDFDYVFVDDNVARFYETEQHTGKLLNWCAGISVLISCLGLLGLAIFTINRRVKEIGIRKVLGAGVLQITTLLTSDFIRLIIIASVITLPIAWYAMSRWLQDFAFHTTISPWIFVVAIGAMMVTALLTMSFQTIKAAMSNPVQSLRNE